MGERADPMIDRDRAVAPPGMAVRSDGRAESDPEVIAMEIDRTRNEMTQTVDALQERLDPDRITEQAVGAATDVTEQARDAAIDVTVEVRDAAKEVTKYAIDEAKSAVRELADQATGAVRASTVGRVEQMAAYTRENAPDMGNDLMTLIRQNPVPAALAAVGIGWLWKQRSSGNGSPYAYTGYSPYSSYTGGGGQIDSAGNLVGQAQHMAGQAVGQAQQKAGHMADQAQSMSEGFTQQAQHTAGQMQHKAQSAFQGISRDPLMMGAVGIALGAVAALMLPETEQERHMIGEARDQMKERVQQMGSETAERVQHAATAAGKAAMREAMSQGSESKAGSATSSA